ncbi:extracellular solute-binding protein [Herbiconiux ginsengi]|uniref:Carbohydrate ABC transporter substrate-binding protein, CUT1 family n=1 Tax=Herbiconiux ginsengi TaxID=381665 RepID=A0A1H3KKG1_9MICO|nr:extracellular solute-binding protein [Herbiconiux ginsengi]SDY52566.1 carbohydrate ABC transporter substrate-binding protein, CUT1 family [Herbiconiux ginsengi]
MPLKRLPLAIGALAASAALLSGCAASAGADPSASVATDIASCDPAAAPITVTFGPQASEAMAIAVANLEKKYPGLVVNAEPQSTTSYDDLTKTIVADIAVGKRPDLIMSGLGQLKFWVDTYQPAPIDTAALASTYQSQFLSAGTVDGTVYLAPAQISAPVLLVNQSILDQAGAGDASDIHTFDDLVAAAKTVTEKTGQPSVTIPAQGLADWYSQAFVQGSGETFVNADGTAGFGTDKGIEALSIWSTLKNDGLEMGLGDQDALAQFIGGKAAFMVYTTSVIASVQKGVNGAFDWMPVDLPSVGGEGGPLPAGGNGWIVLSDDGCRAAFANALVSELLSPDAVSGASGTSYSYIPVDSSAGEALLASSAATPQLTYAWSYDKPLSPWGGFAGAHVAEVNDAFRQMGQALQSGADAKTTVDQAVTTIDQIVAK